jgi:hypothetical protein
MDHHPAAVHPVQAQIELRAEQRQPLRGRGLERLQLLLVVRRPDMLHPARPPRRFACTSCTAVAPVGFQKSVYGCDLRRLALHPAGMITDVSLRLHYLILDRFLSWLMRLRRTNPRRPRTLAVRRGRADGISPSG